MKMKKLPDHFVLATWEGKKLNYNPANSIHVYY